MSTMPINVPVDYAPDVLERVAVRRVASVLARIAHIVQRELLEDIVSSSDDAEVMMRLLEEGGPDVMALLSEGDPLAKARTRGARIKRDLLMESGGSLGAGKVAELLKISRQGVSKRRQSNALLALKAGERFVFPAWQFSGGNVLPGLKRVLRAFTIEDPWMRLAFFFNAESRLEGRRPVDVLRDGDVEAVCAAAAAYGEHGAE